MPRLDSVPEGRAPEPRHHGQPAAAPAGDAVAAGFLAAGVPIVVTDERMRIVIANPAYAALAGYAPGELVGMPLAAAGLDGVPTPPHTACWQGERMQRHRDGQRRPVWARVDTVSDDDGLVQHRVVTVTDLAPFKREQEALLYRAHHDPLTGLGNRGLFDAELPLCMARARRQRQGIALLYIDLDRFKAVNDKLGHAVGDALLQEVSRRLRQTLRAEDLVARMGGDEIAVVLEGMGCKTAAAAAAAMVLAAVGRRFERAGHVLAPAASIGIAMFPEDGASPDALMRAADAAMYGAKQQGGARYAFYGQPPVVPERPLRGG